MSIFEMVFFATLLKSEQFWKFWIIFLLGCFIIYLFLSIREIIEYKRKERCARLADKKYWKEYEAHWKQFEHNK